MTDDIAPWDDQPVAPQSEQAQHEQGARPRVDGRDLYPSFYANPAIRSLAASPRWTVSDSGKAPIDMQEIARAGRIRGAYEVSENCLVSLPRMMEIMPDAANHAYYLRSQVDGYIVLDIEKECPPERAAQLLELPSFYAERSMSGLGYHLVLPLPASFWDYPVALGKKVLREEHGHYELLLDHWTTFTRAELPAVPMSPEGLAAWDALWVELAAVAKPAPTADVYVSADRPPIPNEDQLVDLLASRPPRKTLQDFGGDHSRFEFSVLGTLYNQMDQMISIMERVDESLEYDENHRAWLLYLAATRVLPPRSKHDEVRSGMPLLLNAATAMVARRLADQNDERTDGSPIEKG